MPLSKRDLDVEHRPSILETEVRSLKERHERVSSRFQQQAASIIVTVAAGLAPGILRLSLSY